MEEGKEVVAAGGWKEEEQVRENVTKTNRVSFASPDHRGVRRVLILKSEDVIGDADDDVKRTNVAWERG
jgi:hypothetical protein